MGPPAAEEPREQLVEVLVDHLEGGQQPLAALAVEAGDALAQPGDGVDQIGALVLQAGELGLESRVASVSARRLTGPMFSRSRIRRWMRVSICSRSGSSSPGSSSAMASASSGAHSRRSRTRSTSTPRASAAWATTPSARTRALARRGELGFRRASARDRRRPASLSASARRSAASRRSAAAFSISSTSAWRCVGDLRRPARQALDLRLDGLAALRQGWRAGARAASARVCQELLSSLDGRSGAGAGPPPRGAGVVGRLRHSIRWLRFSASAS